MTDDPMTEGRHARAEELLRVGIIATFVALGIRGLGRPGLLYDEVLFVNAALGGIDDNFVFLESWGVPVLLMPYIGALKAWIYAPIFWIWGVSPETIRIPSFLAFALILYVGARLGRMLFGPFLGLAFLILLASDPALLYASRVDYGPIALMSLCKALALLLFFRWLQKPSNTTLAGLCVVVALGLFDKLNFIWVVIALGAASLTFFSDVRQGLAKGCPGSWLLLITPTVLGAVVGFGYIAPLLRDYETGHEPASVVSWQRLHYVVAVTRETLFGKALWRLLFDEQPNPGALGPSVLMGAIATALLSGAAVFWRPRRAQPSPGRVLLFFMVFSGILLLEILLTPQATGPHHMFVLHMNAQLACFALIAMLLRATPARLRQMALGALILSAGILTTLNVRESSGYMRTTEDPRAFRNWCSPAFYALSERVGEIDADTVVSADWGLHNPLFALAPPDRRSRYRDHWPLFRHTPEGPEPNRDPSLDQIYRHGRTLTITFAPGVGPLPGGRDGFRTFLRARPGPDLVPEIIHHPRGHPLFELYVDAPSVQVFGLSAE